MSYWMKVRVVRDGIHPSEVVVAVQSHNDSEEEFVTVDRRSLCNGAIEIGYPLASMPGKFLVELPHETHAGGWRVWVPVEKLSAVPGSDR